MIIVFVPVAENPTGDDHTKNTGRYAVDSAYTDAKLADERAKLHVGAVLVNLDVKTPKKVK